jgi:superfamily II DNA or RNA helicase/HKD family nuclease
MGGGRLERGRYDAVVDRRLIDRLRADAATGEHQVAPIEDADAPQRLARQLADALGPHLTRLEPHERIAAVNALIQQLDDPDAVVDAPLRSLTSVAAPGVGHLPAPDIPLSQHDLLVHARGEPSLAAELKKELASADQIDLIVAFVRWYGVRLVKDELAAAVQRGAKVRLLTTTYTGSTEKLALDRLRDLGVDIRVSYDTQITRLHAKCWIFHRRSGFATAYVGSSNLTHSAMTDGREWNVRLSKAANAALFDKVAAAFESQWSHQDYEPYDPDRFTQATAPDRTRDDAVELSGLQLRPWPYQDEILDALTVERDVHGRTRNLVVAPTGTGKTVVAALDYARLVREHGDLKLLFVAHREQILRQSRRTFREALGDGAFGELLVGGHRPEDGRHVFASVQTLSSTNGNGYVADDFDVVIVDEFHHAEARTYERLLDRLRCRWLLALTATPERSDGLDIRRWTDGRTAFDMRLWHALDRELLAPFQYFGIADVADLSTVTWRAGQYDRNELGDLFTGNDARDRLIVRQVERIVGDPRGMRALGFCATVEHAQHMADVFTRAGWPAAAIDGTTPQRERQRQIDRLVARELTTIFTRDVFNEGVDIPEVDTILLLRPTESVTVHLQQIGRGLRRHPDKPVCTILDLVGQHRREYRYDLRLRALTGVPRRQLAEAAEAGFPYLPSGCHLELDRQARQWVIDHLKEAVTANRVALRRELQLAISERADATPPPLAEFLEQSGAELEDVAKVGWSVLKRDTGCGVPPPGDDEDTLTSGLQRTLHLDDVDRIDQLTDWLNREQPPRLDGTNETGRRKAWMFLVTIWGIRNAPDNLDAAWQRLWACPAVLADLRETLPLVRERIARPSIPLPDVPLRLHATYARDELLAGFGYVTPDARPNVQAGRWYDEATNTELLFVTLQKTEKAYSPTTMYRDYAISRDRFHWETPNTTTPQSPLGRRYTDQANLGTRILLAVRQQQRDPWGATMPYTLLGPAHVERWEGERPMAVTMRLDNAIPADLYEDFKLAAA